MGLPEKHLAVVIMKSFSLYQNKSKIISLRHTKLYILYKEELSSFIINLTFFDDKLALVHNYFFFLFSIL